MSVFLMSFGLSMEATQLAAGSRQQAAFHQSSPINPLLNYAFNILHIRPVCQQLIAPSCHKHARTSSAHQEHNGLKAE